MSDFYDEQSSSHLLLEGGAAAEGAVTITGPKTHLTTKEPIIDIRGYRGRVFYGMNQFYIEPKEPRIVGTGDAAAGLLIAGCFFYNTAPRFELPPGIHLALLGNVGSEDRAVDEGARAAFAAALDDLRAPGEADLGEAWRVTR
jgi:hypothetical protein